MLIANCQFCFTDLISWQVLSDITFTGLHLLEDISAALALLLERLLGVLQADRETQEQLGRAVICIGWMCFCKTVSYRVLAERHGCNSFHWTWICPPHCAAGKTAAFYARAAPHEGGWS